MADAQASVAEGGAGAAPEQASSGNNNNNNNNNGNKKGKGGGNKKGKKGKKGGGGGGPSRALAETPAFVTKRVAMYEELKAAADAEREALPDVEIDVTLPDGTVVKAIQGKTTPYDVAMGISEGLARAVVVAKVNDQIWDLFRPFEEAASLELCKFNSEEGKHAFWHSSAHILGQALELLYGANLGVGPALEQGFYYDSVLADGGNIGEGEVKELEAKIKKIIKAKQPFERLAIPRETALEMFEENPFKQDIINTLIPEGATVTVYRCGDLIDLCRGPHVPTTGVIKNYKIMKQSAAYWKGDANNPAMQRVYGISFPSKKELKEYERLQEEAAKRDHRKIGLEQQLFFFHPVSPGCCFFLPHGARIYNALVDMIKKEYWDRGYTEVVTPNVFSSELWVTSGHWQNYQDDMFIFDVEGTQMGLKPMNCPGHCLMFKHSKHSFRELPIRLADFGVLHRNESSGSLTGLTRVRRFQQDDSHIFCMPDQIQDEIIGVLDFLQTVYGVFGFTFELELSTRPEKFLGEVEVWDAAEAALTDALNGFGHEWEINAGDGAFYGPKIDIAIMDALRRKHQCATIQLDFQLPIRFDLTYTSSDVEAEGEVKPRPVIIHRAILGSVERMIAILTENYAGKWPFWISPRQVKLVPVAATFNDYAEEVVAELHAAGFHAEADLSTKTMKKKVFEAQNSNWNYICIVGDAEVNANGVNVRLRGQERARGLISREDLMVELQDLRDSKAIAADSAVALGLEDEAGPSN